MPAALQLLQGVADRTPARTVPRALPTPPISAGIFCAIPVSGCTPVSSVKRAFSHRLSLRCTPAHILGSDLLVVHSVASASPAVGTWEPTNATSTWGKGRLLATSVGRDLPTEGTSGCTTTESIKEIPTTQKISRIRILALILFESIKTRFLHFNWVLSIKQQDVRC